MAQLIIHIGFPRTGTTTLQSLFKTLDQIHFIDITRFPWDSINHDLLYGRENHLKRSLNIYKKQLEDFIELNGKNKIYCFSNETLISSSLMFKFRPRPNIWTNDPISIARKLSFFNKLEDLFDKVHIILGLRNQSSLIKSFYCQTYRISYRFFRETNNFEKFFNYTFLENDYGFFSDALYYDQIVDEYIDLFKKENVLVYLLEELENKEFDRFSGLLAELISCEKEFVKNFLKNNQENETMRYQNKSISAPRSLADYLAHLHGRFFPSLKGRWLQHTFLWKLARKIKINDNVNVNLNNSNISFIKDKYKESNLRLMKTLNLDLKKYKYFNNL